MLTIGASIFLFLAFMLFMRANADMSPVHTAAKHILVTGGAGFIGSHAAIMLMEIGYSVTVVDNLSRGHRKAIDAVAMHALWEGQFQFFEIELDDRNAVMSLFKKNKFDVVMHFAAIAFVGESVADPLRYFHNITSNTLNILEAMEAHNVYNLVYSSTCATYGEPEKMPITEKTPQAPINPYGTAKLLSEKMISSFIQERKHLPYSAAILRYFNVIGADPKGRVGESPRNELRKYSRISTACLDVALGFRDKLSILGDDYPTLDGTAVRDYIHVMDLVRAHIMVMDKMEPHDLLIYNVGTGKGVSVKEFIDACRAATGAEIPVEIKNRRPGDYAAVYSDVEKIKQELGWEAKYVSVEDSLRTAWKWRQTHINGYDTN